MKNVMSQMISVILVAFLTAGLIALAAVTNGMTVWFMWRWFVEPLGVAPIGLAHAIGLVAFAAVLTKNIHTQEKEENVSLIQRIFVVPMVIITFSWVVHSAMVW